ncbi:MAG: hypothetical protein LC640_05405, partial [Frankia sp.]|nr:hypothetical protein [Frankia sp.]
MRPRALALLAALLGIVAVGAIPARPAARPPSRAPLRSVVGRIALCPELLKAGSDVTTRLTAGTAAPGEVRVRAASVVPGSGEGPTVVAEGGVVGAFG